MNKLLTHKKLLATALLFTATVPVFAAESQQTSSTGQSDFITLSILLGLIVVQLIIIAVLTNSVNAIIKLKKFKEEAGKVTKSIIIGGVIAAGTYSGEAFAAGGATGSDSIYEMGDGTFWLLVAINIILLGVILYLFGLFRSMVRLLEGKLNEEEGIVDTFTHGLTDAVPVEKEEEVMTDHVYDGIRELDNNLPPWWVGLFWLTIIFSVIYVLHYHILGTGDLQLEEYKKEMAEAEKIRAAYQARQAEKIDEDNVPFLESAAALEKGKELYITNCVSCHGDKGQGGVGPNLTDQYWIHGGSMSDIFKTVKYGVPAKGMIPWQQQLSMSEIHQVSSFVNTLKGNEVEGGKEPQGDLYVPEEGKETISDTLAAKPAADSSKTKE